MSVYLIVNASITDPAKLAEYGAAAGATLADQEFKIHVATNEAETIEGEPAGPRVVVMEFPDRDAFRTWFDSPAYQAIIGLRHASTDGFAVLVDGFGR